MNDSQWCAIVEKAFSDAAFKKRLLAEPAKVLAEEGVAIPEGVTVNIVASTPKELWLVLPSHVEHIKFLSPYVAVQEVENPPDKPAEEAPVESALPEESPGRERSFAWNEPPEISVDARRIEMLEQEVAQLRRELGGLRAEVQAFRDEQRRELSRVQVAQNTSPFYSDAMQLALQGQDAAGISQLCGISRAHWSRCPAPARWTISG